jgi:hypothetical protein
MVKLYDKQTGKRIYIVSTFWEYEPEDDIQQLGVDFRDYYAPEDTEDVTVAKLECITDEHGRAVTRQQLNKILS